MQQQQQPGHEFAAMEWPQDWAAMGLQAPESQGGLQGDADPSLDLFTLLKQAQCQQQQQQGAPSGLQALAAQNAFAGFTHMPAPHAEGSNAYSHSVAPSPFMDPTTQYRDHPGSTASSTSFLTDNGWDDQDLLFTPLLSPAMTAATSNFSPAVSASTYKPIQHQHQQQDTFSLLSSPALGPQPAGRHHPDPPAIPQQQLSALLGNNGVDVGPLLGLQTQAAAAFLQGQRHILQSLGLGHLVDSPEVLAALLKQQTMSPAASSSAQSPMPAPSTSLQGHSPQDLNAAREPATRASKGRGASRTVSKSRPSPLMRPVNASGPAPSSSKALPSPQRARGPPSTASHSRPVSAHASPMFPPSVFSSSGPQPMSHLSLNESPSPIDLANLLGHGPDASSASSGSDHGVMSRLPTSNGFAPITPSTLMNLPENLNMLHGLSPALQPVPEHATGAPMDDFLMGAPQVDAPPPPADLSQPPSAAPTPAPEKKPARKAATRKATANPATSSSTIAVKAKSRGKAKPPPVEADDPLDRKASHKNAEQRRRDSLKECFEELRHLLPHIPPEEDEEAPKRPGEGNIGGQRSSVYDPDHPNKGVSKVALLRKSNVYLRKLHQRVERRDVAIHALREKLASVGIILDEQDQAALQGVSLDDIDEEEAGAWPHPRDVEEEVVGGGSRPLSRRSSSKRSLHLMQE